MRHNMKKRVVVALGGNALGNSLPEQKIWDEKGVCGENWKEGKLIY